MKAAIYTRLSSDPDGTSTACARQEADARAVAERSDWTVVETFTDHDVSAFGRKRRPQFERLLAAVEADEIDVVIVWKSDRLARQPRDLERFLDTAEPHGATLASVTEPGFTGSAGILMLRQMVAFANYESSVKSERIQRKKQELADLGDDGGGPRPFGYRRKNRSLVIDRSEAKEIRAAAKALLSGKMTQTDIGADWNARKVGGRASWTSTRVLAVLRAPRLAALRVHRGVVVGPASWTPILTVEDHERIRSFSDSRKKGKRKARNPYLLAGLAVCALCKGNLSARTDGYYSCSKGGGGCGGVSVRTHYAEEEVERQFLAVVASPEIVAGMDVPQSPDSAPLADELRIAEERVAEIATEYGAGRLTLEEFRPASAAAKERAEVARAALAAVVEDEALARPDSEEILRRWNDADVTERQRWLRSYVSQIIVRRSQVPSRKGFDRDRVRVAWRYPALMKWADYTDVPDHGEPIPI